MKFLREINLANEFIQNHAQSQLHGFVPAEEDPARIHSADRVSTGVRAEEAVEIVPSAMHALSQHSRTATVDSCVKTSKRSKPTINEVAAQAVLFTRAFEKGYVDRLTSTLQQHAARREDGMATTNTDTAVCIIIAFVMMVCLLNAHDLGLNL